MSGRKKSPKKSRSGAKKKSKSSRRDPHVVLDYDEDRSEKVEIDRTVLQNYRCLRSGCGKPAFVKRWCGDTCWGCAYCGNECYEADKDDGYHQRLCRYTDGQDNFELRPVPDDRYARTAKNEDKTYQHKGLFARRDIVRESIVAKQAPIMFKIRKVVADPQDNELVRAGFHYRTTLRRDHPLYASTVDCVGDDEGSDSLAFSNNHLLYFVQHLLVNDLSRVFKWALPRTRSRYWYTSLPFEDIEHVNEDTVYNGLRDTVQRILHECSLQSYENVVEDYNGIYAFDLLTYINHSCEPNMSCEIVGDVLTFFALRDIKENEELTIQYTHVEALVNKEKRNASLWRQFKFTCDCDVCREGATGLAMGNLGAIKSLVKSERLRMEQDEDGYAMDDREKAMNRLKAVVVDVLRSKILNNEAVMKSNDLDRSLIDHDVISEGMDRIQREEAEVPIGEYPLSIVSFARDVRKRNQRSSYMDRVRLPGLISEPHENVRIHRTAMAMYSRMQMFCSMLLTMDASELKHLGTPEQAKELLRQFRIVYYVDLPKEMGANQNLRVRTNDGPTLFCNPSLRFVEPIFRIWIRFLQEPALLKDLKLCEKDREICTQIDRMDALAKRYSHPGFDARRFCARYYFSNLMKVLYFLCEVRRVKKTMIFVPEPK